MPCPKNQPKTQEHIDHIAIKFCSFKQAEVMLKDSEPFTFLLLPLSGENRSSCLYLCFFDQKGNFHKHLIQSIETANGPEWLNGSGIIFKNIEDVIPFSMGVMPGVAKPLTS